MRSFKRINISFFGATKFVTNYIMLKRFSLFSHLADYLYNEEISWNVSTYLCFLLFLYIWIYLCNKMMYFRKYGNVGLIQLYYKGECPRV